MAPKRCPVCGAANANCVGADPATEPRVIQITEGDVPMAADDQEYEVTETDRKGRASTYTTRLSADDVELYRSQGHAVKAVRAADASTKKRTAVASGRASARTKKRA